MSFCAPEFKMNFYQLANIGKSRKQNPKNFQNFYSETFTGRHLRRRNPDKNTEYLAIIFIPHRLYWNITERDSSVAKSTWNKLPGFYFQIWRGLIHPTYAVFFSKFIVIGFISVKDAGWYSRNVAYMTSKFGPQAKVSKSQFWSRRKNKTKLGSFNNNSDQNVSN